MNFFEDYGIEYDGCGDITDERTKVATSSSSSSLIPFDIDSIFEHNYSDDFFLSILNNVSGHENDSSDNKKQIEQDLTCDIEEFKENEELLPLVQRLCANVNYHEKCPLISESDEQYKNLRRHLETIHMVLIESQKQVVTRLKTYYSIKKSMIKRFRTAQIILNRYIELLWHNQHMNCVQEMDTTSECTINIDHMCDPLINVISHVQSLVRNLTSQKSKFVLDWKNLFDKLQKRLNNGLMVDTCAQMLIKCLMNIMEDEHENIIEQIDLQGREDTRKIVEQKMRKQEKSDAIKQDIEMSRKEGKRRTEELMKILEIRYAEGFGKEKIVINNREVRKRPLLPDLTPKKSENQLQVTVVNHYGHVVTPNNNNNNIIISNNEKKEKRPKHSYNQSPALNHLCPIQFVSFESMDNLYIVGSDEKIVTNQENGLFKYEALVLQEDLEKKQIKVSLGKKTRIILLSLNRMLNVEWNCPLLANGYHGVPKTPPSAYVIHVPNNVSILNRGVQPKKSECSRGFLFGSDYESGTDEHFAALCYSNDELSKYVLSQTKSAHELDEKFIQNVYGEKVDLLVEPVFDKNVFVSSLKQWFTQEELEGNDDVQSIQSGSGVIIFITNVKYMIKFLRVLRSKNYIVSDPFTKERCIHVGPMDRKELKLVAEHHISKYYEKITGERVLAMDATITGTNLRQLNKKITKQEQNNMRNQVYDWYKQDLNRVEILLASLQQPVKSVCITLFVKHNVTITKSMDNSMYMLKNASVIYDKGPELSAQQIEQALDAFYWVHLAPPCLRIPHLHVILKYYQDHGVNIRLKNVHQTSGKHRGRSSSSGNLRKFNPSALQKRQLPSIHLDQENEKAKKIHERPSNSMYNYNTKKQVATPKNMQQPTLTFFLKKNLCFSSTIHPKLPSWW